MQWRCLSMGELEVLELISCELMEKSGCSCGGGCMTEVFLMARFCKFEEKCFLNCITLKLILIDVINKHSGILKTKY